MFRVQAGGFFRQALFDAHTLDGFHQLRRKRDRVAEAQLVLDDQVFFQAGDDLVDRGSVVRIAEFFAVRGLEDQVHCGRGGRVSVFGEQLDDALGGVDRRGVIDFEITGERTGQAQCRADGGRQDHDPGDDHAPAMAKRE